MRMRMRMRVIQTDEHLNFSFCVSKEFYMSGCDKNAPTEVEIMWTNQHGTGPKTDDRVETQVILQYMCQAYLPGKMEVKDINRDFQLHTIRNGGNRNTQTFRKDQREDRQIRKDRGLHEPKEYYNAYVRRERNKGKKNLTISQVVSCDFYSCQNQIQIGRKHLTLGCKRRENV